MAGVWLRLAPGLLPVYASLVPHRCTGTSPLHDCVQDPAGLSHFQLARQPRRLGLAGLRDGPHMFRSPFY